MNSILIHGKQRLKGSIWLQGSKNAALPIMAASLMIPGKTTLKHCPDILDVKLMAELLKCTGCYVEQEKDCFMINAKDAQCSVLPKEWVAGMRSSVLLLGAMLGRFHKAVICYPGGCVIGERPIDLHIMALEKLGAVIEYKEDCICAYTEGLKGDVITFPFSSVGATQQAILAASMAEGETIIKNASVEPEVTYLCKFLQNAGICICGIGTRTLRIKKGGYKETSYEIPGDRIVAGTYLLAAAGCGGEVCVKNAPVDELTALFRVLKEMEIGVSFEQGRICLCSDGTPKPISYLKTGPYPEFATDLQPLLAAVLLKASEKSIIEETIFENRFCYVQELKKMGANFVVNGQKLLIHPSLKLRGHKVNATDLRGGAAMVLAGLMAEGITEINHCHYIKRGYEDIVRDFRLLGAEISYID